MELDLDYLIEQKVIEKTKLTKRLTIGGDTKIYDVYKIPLEYLYFNDQNGRINTAYHQYIAKNRKLTPESGDSTYNEKFEHFIYEADKAALDKTQFSIESNGQQEPGVILSDGRVIDGNRRFTAIRRIQRKTGIAQSFEATIISLDIDKKAESKKIKQLELDLQLAREERKSYNPIDRIFDVYNTIKEQKLLSIEEYKKASGASNTRKINRDLRLSELIIQFLEIISPSDNPVEKFYLARELNLDGPIEEIESTLSKLKDNKKAITDIILTTLAVQIMISDPGDKDITRKMREIKTNILNNPEVKEYFVEATDDPVDVLIEYFEENPVEKIQDLKTNIENDKEASDAAKKLLQSTKRLSEKGAKSANRRQALTIIENIRDDLYEIGKEDIECMKPIEIVEVKHIFKEIRDLIFKLEH